MQRTIYTPPTSTATEQQKLRVTAYCRVNIEREEETSSLKSQIAHFSDEKYVGTLNNAIIEPKTFEKVQQENQRRMIK